MDSVDLSPLLASAARSSSASLLTSPSHVPASLSAFPKKRSRLTSSGSVGIPLARPVSPLRSREAETLTPQASSAVTTPPNASPASTEGRPSVPKSPATAFAVSTTANVSTASGISAISPPSSAESPGNLQICIPVSGVCVRVLEDKFLTIFYSCSRKMSSPSIRQPHRARLCWEDRAASRARLQIRDHRTWVLRRLRVLLTQLQ